MAYSCPYCIIWGMKVKRKRTYFRVFCRTGISCAAFFVFGETKKCQPKLTCLSFRSWRYGLSFPNCKTHQQHRRFGFGEPKCPAEPTLTGAVLCLKKTHAALDALKTVSCWVRRSLAFLVPILYQASTRMSTTKLNKLRKVSPP